MSRPITLETARAAKSAAVRLFGELPGVNGIGLCRRDGDYAVKINLEDPSVAEIPDTIEGVGVVVEVVGAVRPRKKR